MKLKNVAKYFNDTRCYDSYSGVHLFDGQFNVYSEGVRDGITVQRRVLELEPGTPIPARRSVEFGGDHWLIGGRNFDMFKGELIREKYVLHRAEDLAQIHTVQTLLLNQTPHEAYGAQVWVKTAKQIEIDSEEFDILNIYFAQGEPVNPHHLVVIGGRTHLVKETYPATAGHLAAISERIDDPVVDTAKTEGKYDMVTEEYGVGSTFKVVRLRWQSDFKYMSQMTPKFERGDMQLATLTTNVVNAGSKIKLSDGDWYVIGTQDRDGARYIHVRRTA